MSRKGGLAFLNKKSWHTSTFKNVERVWQAEQKAKSEAQKLQQLKKELEEERQIEGLRAIQAQAGLISKAQKDRLDWMYAGGPAPSATAEDYLLGKEFKPTKAQDEDVVKIKEEPGSLWLKTSANPVLEDEAKMRDDPMIAILKEEQKARQAILKNPVKMKNIRDDTSKLLEKLKKEARKHKKRKKRHDDSSASDKSDSDSEPRKRRHARHNGHNGHDRHSSHSKHRHGKRSSSPRASSRSRSSSPKRNGERSHKHSRRSRSLSPARHSNGNSNGKVVSNMYGLTHPKAAGGLQHTAASRQKRARSSSPSSSHQRGGASSSSRRPAPSTRPPPRKPLTQEERERRLKEMQMDAEEHDAAALARLKAAQAAEKKEEQERAKRDQSPERTAQFIDKMNKNIYQGKDTLEDRIKKGRHYRQKGNTEYHKFL